MSYLSMTNYECPVCGRNMEEYAPPGGDAKMALAQHFQMSHNTEFVLYVCNMMTKENLEMKALNPSIKRMI